MLVYTYDISVDIIFKTKVQVINGASEIFSNGVRKKWVGRGFGEVRKSV